jgi:hypothetical protein
VSADNWTQCPKCEAEARKRDVRRLAKIQAAYGKVTSEEFVRAINEFSPEAGSHDNNLREDYEQGMGKDGAYTVTYSCSCNTCAFSWKFSHTAQVVDVPEIEGEG